MRQYFKSNLYDRLATRPFLNRTEKLWLIYQLLRAVEAAHSEDVIHADIKPENIMVTSWNWLVLTDFASFKPITIPDDDPTDFQYYFDSSARRRCYVAPERFVKRAGRKRAAPVDGPSGATDAMSDLRVIENDGPAKLSSRLDPDEIAGLKAADVYALGCTIAEVGSISSIDIALVNCICHFRLFWMVFLSLIFLVR